MLKRSIELFDNNAKDNWSCPLLNVSTALINTLNAYHIVSSARVKKDNSFRSYQR